MAKSTEEVRDIDKDTLMEVRGIIDGVLDSGSKDYKIALIDIAARTKGYLDKLVNDIVAEL